MRIITTKTKNSGQKQREMRRFLNFLEELSWVMRNYSPSELESASRMINEYLHKDFEAKAAVGVYESANPNKHFLVGVLPRVFTDEALFPKNEDIAQFASSVMNVSITHAGKRSKYEIIGHIVCETNMLDDEGLSKLVSALAALSKDDVRAKKLIARRKRQNFEWNAIIQELAAEEGQHD
jgi:hypothetical protein